MKVELVQSDGRRHVTGDHKALVTGILEWLTLAREGDKLTLTALGDSHHAKLVKLARKRGVDE